MHQVQLIRGGISQVGRFGCGPGRVMLVQGVLMAPSSRSGRDPGIAR
jgi:hypothetical protein